MFNLVIEKAEKCDVLETRLEILRADITLSVYRNVSRGLFERHKLVFSFLLNMAIYLDAGLVRPEQWNFVLRGAAGTKVVSTHLTLYLYLLAFYALSFAMLIRSIKQKYYK